MRVHPPGLVLNKICTKEYKLPPCKNTDEEVTIEVDTPIIIPLYALHNDPKYFPNPEKFDPDRFSESRISEITKGSYIPFGEGPRICVGKNNLLTLLLRLLSNETINSPKVEKKFI